MRIRTLATLVPTLFLLAHCGGSTTPADANQGDGTDGSMADSSMMDGSIDADSSIDAPASDTPVTTDGSTPSDGSSPCPAYQTLCHGVCIPTSTDPNNCGGCDVTCIGNQVCSGGACSDSCLPTLTACDHACVDLQSDNGNCGACGNSCDAHMGCSAGQCIPTVNVNPAGATCENGGPAIQLGGFDDGRMHCTGDIAQIAFRWAICSCMNVEMSSHLLTDGFDSSSGPYMPGTLGGGVGANNRFSNSGISDIYGALWTASSNGVGTSSPQNVRQELHVNGQLQTSNTFTVGEDGFVNGNISTSSTIDIHGHLLVPTGATLSSGVNYGTISHGPVTVPNPCDCNADQFVPISNIVNYYSTHNDDESIGLDPAVFDSINAPRRLDLPCGAYYFTRLATSAAVTIVAHGHTAIFIGGDIQMSAPLTITLDPTATLDVFIAGTLGTSSALAIGSPNYPALSRIYIGSPSGFTVSSNATLAANFYVPNGPVHTSAPLEVYGGIFAGDFQASNSIAVHYDRLVLRAGEECRPTPHPGDAGVPVDAGPGNPCNTCRDCGNQACVDGACGACRTSADCCAPLECSNGVCVVAPG